MLKSPNLVYTLYFNCAQVHVATYVPETNIQEFMTFYRTSCPEATVLPKMHMLEEHVIPWLRKWHIGFGMMGEQGAESIHKYFNSLARTYPSITDTVERLKCMKEHTAPANVAARPPIN